MARDRLPMKPAADAPAAAPPATGRRRPKGKGAPPSQAIRGKMRLKPKVSKSLKRVRGRARKPGESLPDQSGLRPVQPEEGYVRLRIRVDDGDMSIIDSTMVDSTLAQPPAIHGDFAYEVTEG